MRLFLILIALLLLEAGISSALQVSDVEKDVLCSCGCGKVLENCDCATSEVMREEIRGMIEQGMSKEQIVTELQSMYGKEILANPPKEGVFAGLWYYPVVVMGAGLVVVYLILRRRNASWYADPDEVINEEDIELEH
ncbi:MAG: cytochrome c-type biogenesis protein CcmH [Archaeoglobi archaeon]|nr:cytochrome c-type biogenesis protein CcmH [Archaeoglobi archaeon]